MAKEQLFLLLVCALQWMTRGSNCGDFYSNDPVPDEFYEGDQYPSRDEHTECLPIKTRVLPGTPRYHELVSYNGDNVYFSGYRRMTSRMHTKLDKLAARYYELYGDVLHVLKAWTSYPDDEVNSTSLHYEGRGIRVKVSSSNGSRLLKLAVEHARFDWVKWYGGYAYFCVIPDVCDMIDLVFILDQSGSIGLTNNAIALEFISDVVDFFTIAPNATQIGFITYSSSAAVHFDLNDSYSKSEIQSQILNVGYPGGFSATALGLFEAGVILNPNNSRGARPLDEGIPRVAVLITEGRSNILPIDTVANGLKDSGVQVYTVGIANIYLPELQFIASDPDSLHVFLLDSIDAETFVDVLSYTIYEDSCLENEAIQTFMDSNCLSGCSSSNGCSDFTNINTDKCSLFFDFKFVPPVDIRIWVNKIDCFADSDANLFLVLPSSASCTPRPGYTLKSVQCLERTSSSCLCTARDCLLTFDNDVHLYINSLTCDGSILDSIMSSSFTISSNFTFSLETSSGNCTPEVTSPIATMAPSSLIIVLASSTSTSSTNSISVTMASTSQLSSSPLISFSSVSSATTTNYNIVAMTSTVQLPLITSVSSTMYTIATVPTLTGVTGLHIGIGVSVGVLVVLVIGFITGALCYNRYMNSNKRYPTVETNPAYEASNPQAELKSEVNPAYAFMNHLSESSYNEYEEINTVSQ